MKLLQEDPYELALGAFSAISHQLNNTNNPVYTRPIFIVPKNAATINGFFFASLICSLLSALATLLILQWIEAYKDKLTTSNLKQRVIQRHLRYTGFLKWGVPELVAVLPLILLASVFLFLTGLTVWMWGTNRTIGKIVLAGEVIGSLYYLNAVYAAALFYDAPFKSPFSRIIIGSMRRVKLILDLISSLLHLVDISPLALTTLWSDHRLEEFQALFPLSTRDLEKLHLSSEALKTQTIRWIISQLSSERIFLFQLLQYLQAILNSGGSKGRNEGTTINKFQDISLEVKVIADVLYPNAIEREYDDLDADTLSVLAQCATSELFNNFNYNQLADRKREGVSGLFGDLSMIKDPTGDELKVIVGLAYWRHSPLSKDYLEFWIDLREGKSRRGRQHSSRILEYAMHRIRHLLLTDEPGSSFLVEQIAGKGTFEEVLNLATETSLDKQDTLKLYTSVSKADWFLDNVAKEDRLLHLLETFASITSPSPLGYLLPALLNLDAPIYERSRLLVRGLSHRRTAITQQHAQLFTIILPLIATTGQMQKMLDVIRRFFLNQDAPERFGQDNVSAVRAHLVSLQTAPPPCLSQIENANVQINHILQSPGMREVPSV